jgi:peptide deformylase
MLKIVEWPNSALKNVCHDCTVGDKSLKRLSKQMAQLMYKSNGVGIASPQVGLDIRLIVVDCEDEPYYGKDPLVLVNPVIVEKKGDLIESSEGCLSLPGISVTVERSPYVRVRYYDLEGEFWEIEAEGLLGVCLQHEIDHLDGKTLIEAATPERRLQAVTDLSAARAAGARPGEVGVE